MKHYRLTALSAIFLVVAFVACGGGDTKTAAKAPTAAPAGGNATISGVINYTNGDPDNEINMNADPKCLEMHAEPVTTEMVVAEGGKLANVFVYVKEGVSGNYPAPAEKKILDQQGCTYHPHVSGIMTGQTLVVRNSDETLHNVHAMPTKNEEFNQGQPFPGMELEKEFTTPEVMVRFKCDVHPWMGAYMAVLDHPFFAVSGSDGSFEIKGLPAGDYVIEAWHETLGTKTQSISVTADGAATASFEFASAAG
jgi:plastocyanin